MTESESLLHRSSPTTPYHLTPRRLEISQAVVDATMAAFQLGFHSQVEMCCFWYGVTLAEQQDRVMAVVIPPQLNSWGNYHVPQTAISKVFRATRPLGLKNLAQLHSHPGKAVEHSRYDDQMANSRKALSLVLPHYGCAGSGIGISWGVHEFQNDYWHLLTVPQVSARIALIKDYGQVQLLDLR
jgi:hypothetical protein